MSIDILRLRIFLPTAHFRIIHSSEPQKTYPVPPYSTVIGFLANILGDKGLIGLMLNGGLALGVLSRYDSVTSEYTWLRNLLPSTHLKRFGFIKSRIWQEVSEHIGGQSPVNIEVLNDVHILLYVYHPERNLLETLQQNVVTPEKWYSHLHLGRAEDWAIVNSASTISLTVSGDPDDFSQANQYFQWMPEPSYAFGRGSYINGLRYKEFYQKIQGPAMLITSVYNFVKIPYQEKKGKNIRIKSEMVRNFEHIPTRLFCSAVPFLNDFTLPAIFTDTELNVPIYMANIGGKKSEGRGASCAE